MSGYNHYLKDYNWFKPGAITKRIIDVVGIKGSYIGIKKDILDNYKVMGIEAKASYQDYLNGFCCHCDYTYIIVPKGVIPVDKLPKKIWLIEINLEKYKIKIGRTRNFEFKGIETVKQCSSRRKELLKRKDIYSNKLINTLRDIANRSTINDIYKNPEIKIEGL